jgi:6-pyruvoyl-tetrahydropterin synthase
MHNIFYPNKQTLAVGNEASHNPLNKSSDTVSQYRYEAMSPMSSNIGSFYYDRLEEFLPEKKVVAEKKLIRMQSKYFHLD